MPFHVVIPARHASTRLPGKPLLDIGGVPMIQRVVAQACASAAAEVIVATDDARIAAAVSDPRAPGKSIAVMTDPALPSGTDRVAAVARAGVARRHDRGQRAGRRALPAAAPDRPGCSSARARSGGRASQRSRPRSIRSPNSSTRTLSRSSCRDDGAALYFSRAPIPWTRDGATPGRQPREFGDALRHVGLYAYRVGALRRITSHAALELRATREARAIARPPGRVAHRGRRLRGGAGAGSRHRRGPAAARARAAG